MTRSDIDIKQSLQNYKEPPESKFSGKATYSSLFLLPFTGISINDRSIFKYFINAYVDDADLDHDYKYPIFVLFEVKDYDRDWRHLEGIFIQKENFVHDYTCGMNGNKNLVMFVFECPALFQPDYVRFLNGEYSKFSEVYKRFFSTKIYSSNNIVENPILGVINRTPTTKSKVEEIIGEKIPTGSEYWGIYQPQREIFNF